jgi:hypothetical protein
MYLSSGKKIENLVFLFEIRSNLIRLETSYINLVHPLHTKMLYIHKYENDSKLHI